jgi:hypothetical protein
MRVRLSGSTITAHGDNLGTPYVEFPVNEQAGFPTGWTVTGSSPNRILKNPNGHEVAREQVSPETAPSGGGSGVTVTGTGGAPIPGATDITFPTKVIDHGGGNVEFLLTQPDGAAASQAYLELDPDAGDGSGSWAGVGAGDAIAGFDGGDAFLSGGGGNGGGQSGQIKATGGKADGTGGGVLLRPNSGMVGSGKAGGDVHVNLGTGDGAGRQSLVLIEGAGLPTADPHVVGALYSTAGVVHVSAG